MPRSDLHTAAQYSNLPFCTLQKQFVDWIFDCEPKRGSAMVRP